MRGRSPEAIASASSPPASGGLAGTDHLAGGGARGKTQLVGSQYHRAAPPDLFQTITELRAIGGSGVVVVPVTYIFDEEPPRYKAMLDAIRE